MNYRPYDKLPDHMRRGMRQYIEDGIKPGEFLSAVLCNDLFRAMAHADNLNKRVVETYIKWLCNYGPEDCWGSEENFLSWMKRGGLGLKRKKIQL